MASFDLSVTADIDGAEALADARNLVRLGRNYIRVACARAINRSLKHMRSIISAEIRDIYYVKKKVLDKGIKVYKAAPGDKEMTGVLFAYGPDSQPLSTFEPEVRRNKKGNPTAVSVRVLKANRRRYIKPGGIHKIVATSKGRAAVWMAKGEVMARTEDSGKKLIVLYGPSFMAFFRRPNVAKALNIEAGRYYEKRLAQEISHYLRKEMSK